MNHAPILISGYGSVGRRHFRNLKALGFTKFVFQRTGTSTLPTDEIAEYPQTTDLDEALERKPWLAFVTNPTSLHLPVALRAARSGCHLFIEKPVSNQLEGSEELASLCESSRLVSMIGCQFRFHPLLISLRKQIQDGKLGKITSATAEYGEYLPDWHPWEEHHRSYSARKDLGGGAILTLIHPIDYLYWLFGPMSDICASTSRVESLQTDVEDDVADITLGFSSGVSGRVHLDFVKRPPVHTLELAGARGRARLDFLAGELSWKLLDGTGGSEIPPTGFERNTMFIDEVKHFIECVEQGKRTRSPLNEGIEVLKIALKAKEDAWRRKQ